MSAPSEAPSRCRGLPGRRHPVAATDPRSVTDFLRWVRTNGHAALEGHTGKDETARDVYVHLVERT